MLEVAFQSRRGALVMVGSQETEPGSGWPYHRILGALAANPDMSAQDLGSTTVDAYVAAYDSGPSGQAVTQSALDLTRVDQAAAALDQLAAALIARMGDSPIYLGIGQAQREAQSYNDRDYLDLYDLAALFQKHCASAAIYTAAQRVMDAVQTSGRASLIINSRSLGRAVARSHGVSIYFPVDDRISPFYAGLDMSQATRWDDFLSAYITKKG